MRGRPSLRRREPGSCRAPSGLQAGSVCPPSSPATATAPANAARVGWAKSSAPLLTRGHGARTILPTRQVEHRAPLPTLRPPTECRPSTKPRCCIRWAGSPRRKRSIAPCWRAIPGLLHAVGLPELITGNLDDYEALALRLATDPTLHADTRRKLDRNRTTSPLFDSARLCRHIESAYATMWEMSRRGERPRSFTVEAS